MASHDAIAAAERLVTLAEDVVRCAPAVVAALNGGMGAVVDAAAVRARCARLRTLAAECDATLAAHEAACAEAGGRAACARACQGRGVGALPVKVPMSAPVMLALCVADYLLLLLSAAGAPSGAGGTVAGPPPTARVDALLDVAAGGVGWAALTAEGLAPPPAIPTTPAGEGAPGRRGVRTVAEVRAALNVVRSRWRTLDPETTRVDAWLDVLRTCVGRLAVARGARAEAEVELYADAARVSPAFYADVWLEVRCMQARRHVGLACLRLPPPHVGEGAGAAADEDADAACLARAWAATATDDGAGEVPSTAEVRAWASEYLDTIASEDVMRQVLATFERAELWPGDAQLHAAWEPGEDARPATVLRWRTSPAHVNALVERLPATPREVLAREPPGSPLVAAVVLRTISHLFQNVCCSAQRLDATYAYFDDQLEELGDAARSFAEPTLLQLHGAWCVTVGGWRTRYASFFRALTAWLAAHVDPEGGATRTVALRPVVARLRPRRRPGDA